MLYGIGATLSRRCRQRQIKATAAE